jgi:hypothetical protein
MMGATLKTHLHNDRFAREIMSAVPTGNEKATATTSTADDTLPHTEMVRLTTKFSEGRCVVVNICVDPAAYVSGIMAQTMYK